jgi:hypothetical protein
MSTLKELKIPKYVKGTSYDDYVIKLLSAASTRGKMREVLMGDYVGKMPQPTPDPNNANIMVPAVVTEVHKKNERRK